MTTIKVADALTASLDRVRVLEEALLNVRALISEAAMTGFNYKDGDWAERLFASQQVTSAALTATSSPAATSNANLAAVRETLKREGAPSPTPQTDRREEG